MNLHNIVHAPIIEDWFPNNRNVGFHSPGIRVSCLPESRFPPLRNQGVIRAGIFIVDETPKNETVEEKLIRARSHIDELEHQLFFLWQYLGSEGMWADAEEYLEEHRDDEIPFGWE